MKQLTNQSAKWLQEYLQEDIVYLLGRKRNTADEKRLYRLQNILGDLNKKRKITNKTTQQ